MFLSVVLLCCSSLVTLSHGQDPSTGDTQIQNPASNASTTDTSIPITPVLGPVGTTPYFPVIPLPIVNPDPGPMPILDPITTFPIDLVPPEIDTPLSTPTFQYQTVYRVSSQVGILATEGAEIILPGVPVPVNRIVNAQQDHLDVTDIAADGTRTLTSWDVSELTDAVQPDDPDDAGIITTVSIAKLNPIIPRPPILPQPAPVDQGGDIEPDPLPGEAHFSALSASGMPVKLGSVFVDQSNRIFYAPPTGTLFYAKPVDVYEINSVTHISQNGQILAEWTKDTDDNYHAVLIDENSQAILSDTTPDDSSLVQNELTWLDNQQVLGYLHGRNLDEYSTVDSAQGIVTSTTECVGGQALKINNGTLSIYTPISQPQ